MTYLLTPFYPVNQSDAKQNREAFENAVVELDPELRDRVEWHIYRMADVLIRERGLGRDAAIGQAKEFIAACVWSKAQGRERKG